MQLLHATCYMQLLHATCYMQLLHATLLAEFSQKAFHFYWGEGDFSLGGGDWPDFSKMGGSIQIKSIPQCPTLIMIKHNNESKLSFDF